MSPAGENSFSWKANYQVIKSKIYSSEQQDAAVSVCRLCTIQVLHCALAVELGRFRSINTSLLTNVITKIGICESTVDKNRRSSVNLFLYPPLFCE